MRPRVLFALMCTLSVLGIAIFMIIPTPTSGDQGQQQTLATVPTSVVRDLGVDQAGGGFICGPVNIMGSNIEGDNQGAILGFTIMHDEWPLATSANLNNSSAINQFDDPWNDPGTKTAPADIDKGVLASANSEVCDAVCIIMTVSADDNVMARNVPIDKGDMGNKVLCSNIPIGLDPDGGRQAQIMANADVRPNLRL